MHHEADASDSQDDTLRRIAMLARRTLNLVDDFVHLTRAESMAIRPVELDLGSLLQDGVDEFWAAAQKEHRAGDAARPARGLCAGRPDAADAGAVQPDRQRDQVQPGRYPHRLRHREDDGYWRISVRDQGRGIAAQDLDSLFEPFSRMAADTRKDVGGAGLAWPSCARWRNATAAPRRSAVSRAGARSSACGCRWRRSTTANSRAPPRHSKTCEITAGLPALISSVPRYGGRSALCSTTDICRESGAAPSPAG